MMQASLTTSPSSCSFPLKCFHDLARFPCLSRLQLRPRGHAPCLYTHEIPPLALSHILHPRSLLLPWVPYHYVSQHIPDDLEPWRRLVEHPDRPILCIVVDAVGLGFDANNVHAGFGALWGSRAFAWCPLVLHSFLLLGEGDFVREGRSFQALNNDIRYVL